MRRFTSSSVLATILSSATAAQAQQPISPDEFFVVEVLCGQDQIIQTSEVLDGSLERITWIVTGSEVAGIRLEAGTRNPELYYETVLDYPSYNSLTGGYEQLNFNKIASVMRAEGAWQYCHGTKADRDSAEAAWKNNIARLALARESEQ